jgi:ACR3 family arsenite transporter
MDTVEKGVANDPRPDAGLGRINDATTYHNNGSEKAMDVSSDLEAQSKEQRERRFCSHFTAYC